MANKFWKAGGCHVEELALPTHAIQLLDEVLSTDEAASVELREAEAAHQTRSSSRLVKAVTTTPCICRELPCLRQECNKHFKHTLESYSTAAVQPSQGCSLPRCRTQRRLWGRVLPGPEPHTTAVEPGKDLDSCFEPTINFGQRKVGNTYLEVSTAQCNTFLPNKWLQVARCCSVSKARIFPAGSADSFCPERKWSGCYIGDTRVVFLTSVSKLNIAFNGEIFDGSPMWKPLEMLCKVDSANLGWTSEAPGLPGCPGDLPRSNWLHSCRIWRVLVLRRAKTKSCKESCTDGWIALKVLAVWHAPARVYWPSGGATSLKDCGLLALVFSGWGVGARVWRVEEADQGEETEEEKAATQEEFSR